MKDKIKAAVIASFIGDALSLGVHWIYNTNVIDKKYGRVEFMLKPELAKYHASKGQGEFTHYGDQMMILLKSISDKSEFDLKHFAADWQNLFRRYNGYLDGATKDTIKNFDSGKTPQESGSSSSDLGGAARIAPLISCYYDSLDDFKGAARAQTAMTHNHSQVIACSEIFSEASFQVLSGTSPIASIIDAMEAISPEQAVKDAINLGLESKDKDTRKAILDFGQMCAVEAALPSTIHIIAKYEDNLKQALVENIMAGGDSAARGMLVGFILGCYQGLQLIPKTWLEDMVKYDEIVLLIDRVLKR